MAEKEPPSNKDQTETAEKEPVISPDANKKELSEDQIDEATSPLGDFADYDQQELERIKARPETVQESEQVPEEGVVQSEEPALTVSPQASQKEEKSVESEKAVQEKEEEELSAGGDDETPEKKTVKEKSSDKKSPEKNDKTNNTPQDHLKEENTSSEEQEANAEHLKLALSVPDTPAGLEKELINLRSGALKPHNFHDYLAILFMANSALGLEHGNSRLKLDLSQTAKKEILAKLGSFQDRAEFHFKTSYLKLIDKDSPVKGLLSGNSHFLLEEKEENISKLEELKGMIFSELEKEDISTAEAAQVIAAKQKNQSKEKDQ